MEINIKKVITITNEALRDLKNLDISNWTTEEKQEMQSFIEEVIALALLAKQKVQTL